MDRRKFLCIALAGASTAFGNLKEQSDIACLKRSPIIEIEDISSRNKTYHFTDIINVKDFGAKGDGITDDTAAIQSALNLKGSVFIPKGVYIVSGLYIKSDTLFYGAGVDSTIIKATNGNAYSSGILNEHAFIRLRDGVTALNQVYDQNIFIEDMTIDLDYLNRFKYNSTKTYDMYGCGVGFGGVKDSCVCKVKVINPGLHGFNTQGFSNKVGRKDLSDYDTVKADGYESHVAVGRCINIQFDSCIVEGCFNDDAFTTHVSDNIKFINCKADFFYTGTKYGRMAHRSQCGFEIDGCCRSCSVIQCEAYNLGRGFTVASHPNEVPTINSSFICCYAKHCCVSFGSWKGTNPGNAKFDSSITKENVGLSIIACVSDSTKRARARASADDNNLRRPNFISLNNCANTTIIDFTARGKGDGGTISFAAARFVNIFNMDLQKDINTRADNGEQYGRIRILQNSQNIRFVNLCIRSETTYAALFEPSSSTGLQVVDGLRFDEEPTNTVEKPFYLVNTTLNGGTQRFQGEIKNCSLSSYTVRHYASNSVTDYIYTRESTCDSLRFSRVEMGKGDIITESVYPKANSTSYCGKSSNKWTGVYTNTLGSAKHPTENVYVTTGPWSSSDERKKENISDIQTEIFKAWENVDFKIFRFKDAICKKGENARYHIGVIAQNVEAAFLSNGIDAGRFGLFCHDKWKAEWEEIENGEKKLVQEAGDAYGIRYEEALALEAAYQRWRADKAEARIAKLEKRLDDIENRHFFGKR